MKYILIFFISLNGFIFSQNLGDCFFQQDTLPFQAKSASCSNTSPAFLNKYRKPEQWISNANVPVKTILVNWIICQKTDGSNAWQDGPALRQQINEMFDSINYIYSNVLPKGYSVPCEVPINYITDTKIRFELNEIIFIQNDIFNNESNGEPIIDYINLMYPHTKYQFNHIFSMPQSPPDGRWGYYRNNYSLKYSFVHTYHSMFSDNFVVFTGHINHIAHEYGHAVGLHHPYDAEIKTVSHYDFLDDIYGSCAVTSCCSPTTGNVCPLTGACFWSTAQSPKPLMNGTDNQRYISPKQSGRMHRALSLYDNNFVVSNTFMHKYVKEITSYATPYNIVSNEVWDFKIKMYQDIIVKTGYTLTIQCEVMMPNNSKIIVEPGGRLIIDGGTITNYYFLDNERKGLWQGIEVWGTSNQHQYPTSGSTYQGMLILKNGGTIENAHIAAVNWKQDDWSKIGGIIQCTDGIFRNNRRDVGFMSYSNFLASNPSIKVPNLSFFKNTAFVSDDNFIEKGYAIQQHVTLWEVSGINFTNCHFSNEITTNKSNSSAPNQGIYSIDAGYKVLAGCSTSPPFGQPCPSSNLLKSSFSGFSKAVEITGTSTTETVTIQQSEFINNINGISVDEFDNVSINRNEIEIGNAGYVLFWPSLFVGTGVNVVNSTGYIIEENTISTNLTVGNRSGINITNGGEDDHRLYKNTLDGLTIGTRALGVNHNSNYQRGMQFLCNEYQNNATAIQIQTSPTSDGVRFYQGDFSPNKASGNTFVNNTKGIVNNTNSLVYYHKGVNSLPLNNSGLISVYEATNPNTCPTSFGGGGIIMRPLALLLDDMGNLTEEHNNLHYTYVSLIDGGNTEQFKNNIEINWSDDAWLLREKLIERSPYLSSEVLLKTAEQNVLPNGMLLEVLLANPDATRGESFIENLKEITNNTFPEYMLDYVRNNWDTKTLRTNLEGQMSSVNSDLSTTRNFIKYLKKSEDENTYGDRFDVAKMGNTISHKVGLMDFFIANNQFTKADSVLQAVMNDKVMKDELKQIEYYEDYLSFRSSLDGRNLAQLDSNEINYLQTLAENSGRAAGYAQNILCFFYNICYEQEFNNGDIQPKSMSITANSSELESIMYNITVYPNPSEEFTSIKWEIYDQLQNAQYKVFDLNGNEVASSLIDNNKGEKVIDTRSLRNGIYIIGIYNNDEVKANKKLVVNHKN